jgi:hypothetical protein
MLAAVYFKICEEKPHIAFLEVVEGDKIYNFCVQSLVEFYSKFWRNSNLKSVPATHFRAGRQHAATSRARASPAEPRRLCPHAPSRHSLRPRHVLPEIHAPRRSLRPRHLEPRRPRRRTASCARRTPGPSVAPAVRTTLEPPWHGDALPASPADTRTRVLIKPPCASLAPTPPSHPTVPCRAIGAAAGEVHPPLALAAVQALLRLP